MPDKHEVGGSSPLGPTSATAHNTRDKHNLSEWILRKQKTYILAFRQGCEMLIENRIKKNETKQIVVYDFLLKRVIEKNLLLG